MGQLDMAIFWWLPVQPFMVHLLNPASCTAWHGSEWNLLGGIEVVGIFHTHLGSSTVVYQCITKRDPKMGTPSTASTKSADPKFLFSFCTENGLLTVTQNWNIVAPCQHGFDIWRPTITHKWHPKDPLLNQTLWRTGNPGPAKSGWKRRGGPKSQQSPCQLLTVSKWVIMQ